MPTALSDVDICNLSFDLLRHKDKVTSIETPASDSEALAARWYHTTRRAVLGAYPWNFARKRALLSLNAIVPIFGYANAYNLPDDYIAVVFLGENYNENYEKEYAVEGAQIVMDNSDAAALQLCYIHDILSVARYDPLFIELLTAELAIRFGNSITGLNKGLKEIYAWKKDLDAKARTKNGRDNPVKVRNVSKILNKRRQATQGANITDGTHLFS
jgi:hypothetical protein